MARCLACGCTDERACIGGCFWLVVDQKKGVGICSSCPQAKDAPLSWGASQVLKLAIERRENSTPPAEDFSSTQLHAHGAEMSMLVRLGLMRITRRAHRLTCYALTERGDQIGRSLRAVR